MWQKHRNVVLRTNGNTADHRAKHYNTIPTVHFHSIEKQNGTVSSTFCKHRRDKKEGKTVGDLKHKFFTEWQPSMASHGVLRSVHHHLSLSKYW